jgi:hypothetical protein
MNNLTQAQQLIVEQVIDGWFPKDFPLKWGRMDHDQGIVTCGFVTFKNFYEIRIGRGGDIVLVRTPRIIPPFETKVQEVVLDQIAYEHPPQGRYLRVLEKIVGGELIKAAL